MKIQIQKPIRSNDASMQEEDIFTVKSALNRLGYYPEPEYGITPYADRNIFDSIELFQKDNNLKKDAIVNPDGETLREINKRMEEAARSPTLWCTICGGPHGGSKGDICPSCHSKL